MGNRRTRTGKTINAYKILVKTSGEGISLEADIGVNNIKMDPRDIGCEGMG
jgi:hypothetical protein